MFPISHVLPTAFAFTQEPGAKDATTGVRDATTGIQDAASGLAGETSRNAASEMLAQLQVLGWIDATALAVLVVFFVLGLFKGLFWQVSRIAILLVAYGVAGRFGGTVGHWLSREVPEGSTGTATVEGAGGASMQPDTALYLAYVFVFLAVLVLLSLIAMQIQKLVKKTGLSFFDRIGGGVFGVATGACTVLFLLFCVNMFFHDTALATDAQASHSQRLSKKAIDWLGPRVPDELRGALHLMPLRAGGEGVGGEGSQQPDSPKVGNQLPGAQPGIVPEGVPAVPETEPKSSGSGK